MVHLCVGRTEREARERSTMGPKLAAVFLLGCFVIVKGNPPADTAETQKFQAEKFLDMLGRTFDTKVAYSDLLAALHRRMNLDPISVSNSTTAAAPDASGGSFGADQAANCPNADSFPGASITYTSPSHEMGSRAFYQCEPGYEGRSQFIQCMHGGKWSAMGGWAGCKPLDCGAPPPSVTNASPTYTTTTYGSVVFYSCQSGYKSDTASPNVTCLETGRWSTPSFTCDKAVAPTAGGPNGMNLALIQAMMGGGGGNAAGANTNTNPMLQALMQMQGATPGAPDASGGNAANNAAMAAMMQMFPGMAPPTPPPTTTPAPPAANDVNSVLPNGFQLPNHLKNLLPNGISNTQGMRPQDLMTLASLGMGSANPAAAPRDINQLLGTMNPMSLFGGSMGMNIPGTGPPTGAGSTAPGGPGVPPDPEKMAEQREEMMMRAMMASAMKSMMGNRQQQQQPSGNSTAQATQRNNPAMDMMALMALQSQLGGASGGGGGGGAGTMDPMMMMMGMNPAMLGLGGGGGGGGGGLFGGLSSLFGAK